MRFIWVTRGKEWGFRFLERGGLEDPLGEYEAVFAEYSERTEVCELVGDRLALRIPDPLERRDSAGRVIPHDFVVFPPESSQIGSVQDGIEMIWALPNVADRYALEWDVKPQA